MTDLNMQLILRLVDRATGPAKAALQKVQQTGAAMEASGRRNIALADRMAERNRARSAALMGETAQVVGLTAALYGLTEPAIQAEARMAEVAKTVTFDDDNGIARLRREIQELVTDGGLSAKSEQIMDIVAAAGRLGVVDKNLPDAEKREAYIAFATNAAKISKAFGISADDAAVSLARWRNNLGLSAEQSLLLADRVNFLGNSYATSEADILEVMKVQAGFAKQAGLTAHETAALATAILDTGVAPAVAGTGMKNFLRVLGQGEAVTDRQRKAFEELGFAPVKLAKAMQEDATPAIFSVLKALEGVEDHRRNAIVGQLFGQESITSITQLLGSTDRYREMVEATADANAMLGLTEEEYQRQAATTKAARLRLVEYFKRLSTVIGDSVLPMLNEMMETVMPVIGQVTEWASQNPELIEQLGWITAGLFGVKLASLALRFALLPLFSVISGGARTLGLLKLGFAALAGRAPLRLASLVKPLKWTAKLIPVIPWLALVGGKFALAGLVTALKWTSRLIPVIGWAFLAGELLWHMLIKPLGWDKYLPSIDWSRVWGAFSWEGWLPEVEWSEFISAITWPDWVHRLAWADFIPLIDWSHWFSFTWASVLPKWDWTAIIPEFNLGTRMSLSERQARDTPNYPGMDNRPRKDGSRALGGPVRAGFAYEINEQGQELFTPAMSGRVIPAREARALSGGAGRAMRMSVGDIHVHAAPGQSAEAIAEAVMERLDRLRRRGDDALHDGGRYD